MGDAPVSDEMPTSMAAVRIAAEALARAHVAGGGKVCGYLTPYAPVELIAAAGFLPMALGADVAEPTPHADHHMEGLFDRGIRGVFERLLRGDFAYLDAIVLPRANDSAHRLYYYLCELSRIGAADLPPALLFDLSQTADDASQRYSLVKTKVLCRELEALGAKSITDTSLGAAVKQVNLIREALGELAARRRTAHGSINGETALAAFAGARMAPPAIFLGWMERLLARPVTVQSDAVRVVVCGSAANNGALHALIEAAGGCVVGDMHAGGELAVGGKIDSSGDPLAAIVEAYRSMTGGSRDLGDAAALAASFMQRTGADAAIFRYTPEEEALTWDYPAQARSLERDGVKVLRLSSAAQDLQEADLVAVEAFVKSIIRERAL